MVGHGAAGLGVKPLAHGNLVAREAVSDQDIQLSLDLRRRAFIRPNGSKTRNLSDADHFDPVYNHVLIERRGNVAACFRIKIFADPHALLASHSGSHYDLGPLSVLTGPFADIGRLAVGPGDGDPDVLRMVWGMLARLVETHRLRYLLGCTSFVGADPVQHAPRSGSALRKAYWPADFVALSQSRDDGRSDPGRPATRHVTDSAFAAQLSGAWRMGVRPCRYRYAS